ncbi:unnamed protein product [Urochloa humidicola]
MDCLPGELLADILRRLRPRHLAVCRRVSKDLRAIIDGRGLLLALEHHMPHNLRGIFVNYVGQNEPSFFSRPERAAPRIDAELRFLAPIRWTWREFMHQCNGLLLLKDRDMLYVCNPATRRWQKLPPRPEGFGNAAAHLVFDPAVSLHYHYFVDEIKNLPSSVRAKYDREGSVEWLPSLYAAQVFSSRTCQWEERAYVRENDVVVTLSDVRSNPWGPYSGTRDCEEPWRNGIYWRATSIVAVVLS